MIVPIPQDERIGFEKVCATFGVEVKFYTQENNEGMITLELPDDLSMVTLFHLIRTVDIQNEIEKFIKK